MNATDQITLDLILIWQECSICFFIHSESIFTTEHVVLIVSVWIERLFGSLTMFFRLRWYLRFFNASTIVRWTTIPFDCILVYSDQLSWSYIYRPGRELDVGSCNLHLSSRQESSLKSFLSELFCFWTRFEFTLLSTLTIIVVILGKNSRANCHQAN